MRMDKRELKWEHMLAGISSQPAYLQDGAAQTLHASALNLPLRVPSRIYLVGCGDSHYAGLATRFAFEQWSGIPTEALIAQVLRSKHADYLPLYRQAQIYTRQGVELDRSTSADLTGRAGWNLRPRRDHVLEQFQRSERSFAD